MRQALFNSLMTITGNEPLRTVARSVGADLGRGIDLVRAKLDELIMDGFNFSEIDLIEASMRKSSLIQANFAGANLWKAKIVDSNLAQVDLTDARLWDARIERSNLWQARFLTRHINDHSSLAESYLQGGVWPSDIDPRRMGAKFDN